MILVMQDSGNIFDKNNIGTCYLHSADNSEIEKILWIFPSGVIVQITVSLAGRPGDEQLYRTNLVAHLFLLPRRLFTEASVKNGLNILIYHMCHGEICCKHLARIRIEIYCEADIQ